jgi:uncharacterized protein involved in type VI secretion and phage assembly
MDEKLARFIERSENKLWGKYRGLVENRDDPEQLGRLKLRVPSLLGDAVTGWAWPVVPYAGAGLGFFFMPQVGDMVWVEFAEGELEHPLWTGCGWAKPGQQTEIPEDAKDSYPDQNVLRTKYGHVIILSDAPGGEMITIRAKNGCEITVDPNGDVVTVKAGTVNVQSANGQVQELATKTFVQNLYDMHQHPSGVGPTGPPLPNFQSTSNPQALTRVLKAE